MKQLFLCSYFGGVKNLFRQYVSEKQLGKHVLFIPTAGNVEEYRGYIDEALQTFADLGFQVEVLDISACDRETAQAKIFQSKILYVSGGNTFYLLQELKKKQLLSLIKEQIADGMVMWANLRVLSSQPRTLTTISSWTIKELQQNCTIQRH